jgi:hypothetical protein
VEKIGVSIIGSIKVLLLIVCKELTVSIVSEVFICGK